MSISDLERCISKLEVYFGPLIPNNEERIKVLQLLYQYCHLNLIDLLDLLPTNLIIYQVKLALRIKPYLVS